MRKAAVLCLHCGQNLKYIGWEVNGATELKSIAWDGTLFTVRAPTCAQHSELARAGTQLCSSNSTDLRGLK